MALGTGEYGAARDLFAESLRRQQAASNAAGIAEGLGGMAALATAQGQLERAARLFGAGGVLLTVWCNLLFRRAHTSLVPVKPTQALVMSGPYKLTRNPMYLGLLWVYIAAALWLGLAWAVILVPLLVLAVQRLAIAKEERYLERAFGDAYRQYQARVRRWI